jgi:hypothetical protein
MTLTRRKRTSDERHKKGTEELQRLASELADWQRYLRYLINPYIGTRKRIPGKVGDYIHMVLSELAFSIQALGEIVDDGGKTPKKKEERPPSRQEVVE